MLWFSGVLLAVWSEKRIVTVDFQTLISFSYSGGDAQLFGRLQQHLSNVLID